MIIDHHSDISVDDVIRVSDEYENVEFSRDTVEAIQASNDRIKAILADDKPVYGVNTGFGIFADKVITKDSIQKLNRNLILSHAVGTGNSLDERIVRAAMFVRAVTLSKGYSGVRQEIIKNLLTMLNRNVTPVIPEKGSLGSSGDLCQLSHLALVLTKDENDLEDESGRAIYEGKEMSGKQAMEKAGIEREVLQAKEGLALNNGATFSAAIAAITVYEAEYLIRIAEINTALCMEALCARSNALDKRLHIARRQIGQIDSASNIQNLVKCSGLLDSLSQVQDAYSIRCAPQVIGAINDTVAYVKSIVEREINAVTDNPLVFENGEAISGGNFHGEPVGLAMDYLSIAMSELGSLSERQTFRLTDEKLNHGLPPMLVGNSARAGLNSGLMLAHYTATSLVLENQTLATPDAIKSLPTSANQEDHNSNAMTAARHTYEIVENLRQILSIGLYSALRAIELRMKISNGKLGEGTGAVVNKLQEVVTFIPEDTLWGVEIGKINQLLKQHEL